MRTALLTLVVLASVAACTGPGTTQTPAAPATPETITVGLVDFALDPSELSVDSGKLLIEVTNAGPTPHNLTIRDAAGDSVLATPDLRRGESATLEGELAAGEYTIFCALPGHESLGMRGTLTVGDG